MSKVHALNADEWRDIASQSFVPLSFQRSAAEFTASMDHRQLSPDVSLSKIETQALIIDRTPRLVAKADSDDIHISLQVNAGGSIIQNGHVVPVGPGVVTLCETNKPFTLNYTEPNQRHIVLQTSRAALGVDDAIIEELAGRQITRANPARDAFASFISSFMANKTPYPQGTMADMSGVVTSLAAAMLRTENAFSRSMPDKGEALLATIIDFIQANLASPMLTPELISQMHFISRRRLYELFVMMKETPSDFIRSERLTRAATTLRDPAQREMKISDVAYGLGFNDITTFTRAFYRRYAMTPRDYRAQAGPSS